MKVVINKCFGGFNLSEKAIREIYRRGGEGIEAVEPIKYYGGREGWEKDFEKAQHSSGLFSIVVEGGKVLCNNYGSTYKQCLRGCPILVSVVEELGDEADGEYAELKIVEIPDDVEYEISEYDGREHIAEKHRTWG